MNYGGISRISSSIHSISISSGSSSSSDVVVAVALVNVVVIFMWRYVMLWLNTQYGGKLLFAWNG